jgi:methionyl-tRNA formyltransferase
MKPFRILIITQNDPFYVRLFFETFFKEYTPMGDIRGVVIAPAMGKKSVKKLIRQMYDFYGPVDFVRMGLRYAWHKACDLLSRVIPLRRFHSISQVCQHYHVPVSACTNLNAEEFLDGLRRMELDLIVSVAAPQIFKESLIKIPRHGCINIHHAKLPQYRGMMPNFWQMLNGEKTVGITIHRISAGIDNGEILLQKETPILNGESLDSIIQRTKTLGGQFMIEAIDGFKRRSLTPLPNPSKDSTYFSFPTKHDVAEFRRRGHRML